jgi:hypothetical protein
VVIEPASLAMIVEPSSTAWRDRHAPWSWSTCSGWVRGGAGGGGQDMAS